MAKTINPRKELEDKPRRAKRDYSSFSAIVVFIVFVISLYVTLSFINSLFPLIKQLIYTINPDYLQWGICNEYAYYIPTYTMCIILSICVSALVWKRQFPRRIIRNKEYLLLLFDGRPNSSPHSTRKLLMKSIYGSEKIDKDTRKTLSSMIDESINIIKDFINEKSNTDRILCINSRWGSGKTTSLLIAINESNDKDKRFIYESTFKYNGSVNELFSDILNTLNDTMAELGIKKTSGMKSLIRNLDTDFERTIINTIQNANADTDNILSSDIIVKINQQYKKLNKHKTIYIILDDLDRLQGEDIIRVLSLLSILRNLVFVKIIVPADTNVVIRALDKQGVVDSARFIEKYLPINKSVKINTGYEYTDNLLREKIFTKQTIEPESGISIEPALLAIYLKMLWSKMQEYTSSYNNIRYTWLTSNVHSEPTDFDMNEGLGQLLRAPNILYSRSNKDKYFYDWNRANNNIQKFQNIVCALVKTPKNGGKDIAIKNNFREEDYEYAIQPWVSDYIRIRWDLLGLSMRDALNILSELDYRNLPGKPGEQFAYVFNQLFPEDKIKYVDNQ